MWTIGGKVIPKYVENIFMEDPIIYKTKLIKGNEYMPPLIVYIFQMTNYHIIYEIIC